MEVPHVAITLRLALAGEASHDDGNSEPNVGPACQGSRHCGPQCRPLVQSSVHGQVSALVFVSMVAFGIELSVWQPWLFLQWTLL